MITPEAQMNFSLFSILQLQPNIVGIRLCMQVYLCLLDGCIFHQHCTFHFNII